MIGKLRKAIERRLSAQDILSYAAITLQRHWSKDWGTLALRLKALLFGVEVGPGVTACGSVILGRWPGSHIRLGAGCSLISSSRRATASTLYAPVRLRTYAPTARIDLAEGVQLSGTAITARSCTISIGKDTMVGPNCVITDSDFHAHWPAETRHIEPAFELDRGVSIGANVWIGMNALILKGVTIGDGAIVAAGTRRAQAQAVDGVLQLRLQRGQLGVGVHVVPPAGGDGLAAELGGNVHLAADADADAVGGAGLAAGVDGGLQDEALQAGEVFAQLGGGHNLHGVAQLGAAALKADDEVDVFLAGVVFILDIARRLCGM